MEQIGRELIGHIHARHDMQVRMVKAAAATEPTDPRTMLEDERLMAVHISNDPFSVLDDLKKFRIITFRDITRASCVFLGEDEHIALDADLPFRWRDKEMVALEEDFVPCVKPLAENAAGIHKHDERYGF